VSGISQDVDEFGTLHKRRRTTAMASLKVNSSLTCQAADLGWRTAATLASAAGWVFKVIGKSTAMERPRRAPLV
jgi:hypothetical protein